KDEIHDMAGASGKIMRLRPVTFRYKSDLDPSGTRQYGLVAEEVAQVMPELVARDKDGRTETVKYQVLVPMLLNELQKQARKIEALTAQVRWANDQAQEIPALTARLAQLETVLSQEHAPTQQASCTTRPGF